MGKMEDFMKLSEANLFASFIPLHKVHCAEIGTERSDLMSVVASKAIADAAPSKCGAGEPTPPKCGAGTPPPPPPTQGKCGAPVDVGSKSKSSLGSILPIKGGGSSSGGGSNSGGGSVEYGSMEYYMLCALGGALSCGLTHTAITPLDLVKCRIQVDPKKYKNLAHGLKVTVKEEGLKGIAKGWAPTLIGYSLQGMFKFGFYEMFKIIYSNMMGEEGAYLYRTYLYLAASASAEFFADIALSPMEAVKVRIQTQPGYPHTLRKAFPRILKEEGPGGFYKSIVPLWSRQIPYTMMKFASFERTVELLYQYVVRKPRDQTTKQEQLVVTFAAGYIAGVFCAVVSHPADTLVSQLNKDKGSSAGEIIKKLGFKGLWGGLGARIIMVGTLTALQWFIYDGVKVALGLPRPPPPSPPASLRGKLDK